MYLYVYFIYKNTIPSFVRAVNLTPTGTLKRADCNAICSFPEPEAIDNATSKPSNLSFSFFSKSFF